MRTRLDLGILDLGKVVTGRARMKAVRPRLKATNGQGNRAGEAGSRHPTCNHDHISNAEETELESLHPITSNINHISN